MFWGWLVNRSIMPLFSARVYNPVYSVTNVQSFECICFYTRELLLWFLRCWPQFTLC